MSPGRMIQDEIGASITKDNELYKDKTAKYLARLRYDLRRRELGLCPIPACPNKTAKGLCTTHKVRYNERMRGKTAR
jgi:hypothetical protein